jgi:NADH-quinone oxidoreductase subunit K
MPDTEDIILHSSETLTRTGAFPGTSIVGFFLPLFLFLIAFFGLALATKKNIILNLICFEIMFAVANLILIAGVLASSNIVGLIFMFFALIVAGCEVAVGLALIIAIYREKGFVTTESVSLVQG